MRQLSQMTKLILSIALCLNVQRGWAGGCKGALKCQDLNGQNNGWQNNGYRLSSLQRYHHFKLAQNNFNYDGISLKKDNNKVKVVFYDNDTSCQATPKELLTLISQCSIKAVGISFIHEEFKEIELNEITNENDCYGRKEITKDYVPCKNLISLVNKFSIGRVVLEQGHYIHSQTTQADLQAKAWEESQVGQNTTSTMEALKGGLDTQYNHQIQKAGASALEFATLNNKINSFPTPKKARKLWTNKGQEIGSIIDQVVLKLNERRKDETTEFFTDQIIEEVTTEMSDTNPINEVFLSESQLARSFFKNQEQLNIAKQRMYQVGLKMGLEGANILLMRKHLNQLKKDIAALKDKKDNALEQEFDPDLYANPCLVNPLIPACQKPNETEIETENFSLGDYQFGGEEGQSVSTTLGEELPNGLSPTQDLGIGDAAILPGMQTELVEKLSDEVSVAGGGGRPSLGGGQSSGGGSGAGAGGAGAGGGGGGGVSSKDFQKRTSNGRPVSDIRDQRAAPTGSWFSRKGRKGSQRNIANLLKKNAKDNIKGTILSYRLPASVSPSNSSIFQRISSRYDKVEKTKRLLEYEVQ